MRNKLYAVCIVVLFLVVGPLVWVYQTDRSEPSQQTQEPPSTPVLSNQKEGWGFLKSENGGIPQIAPHQWELINKYDAIFVGDRTQKKVYLTFDLGYEKEGHTPKILDILRKHKVKAAFFATSHFMETNPDLAKQIVQEGHILGNHSWSHRSLPDLSDDEVKEEIERWWDEGKKTGEKHKFFRPPMGEYSERTLKITKDLGYRTVFWSIALVDWVPMSDSQEAVDGVIEHLHNGAVILLHGVSADVVARLEDILTGIRAKGYEFGVLTEIKTTSDIQSPGTPEQ